MITSKKTLLAALFITGSSLISLSTQAMQESNSTKSDFSKLALLQSAGLFVSGSYVKGAAYHVHLSTRLELPDTHILYKHMLPRISLIGFTFQTLGLLSA